MTRSTVSLDLPDADTSEKRDEEEPLASIPGRSDGPYYTSTPSEAIDYSRPNPLYTDFEEVAEGAVCEDKAPEELTSQPDGNEHLYHKLARETHEL